MTKSKLQRERLKFEPHSPKTLGGNRYSLIEDNKAYPPSECDQFFPNLSKLKPVTITPSTTNTPEPQKPMVIFNHQINNKNKQLKSTNKREWEYYYQEGPLPVVITLLRVYLLI